MGITKQLDKLMKSRGIKKSDLAREANIPYTTIQGLYVKSDENVKLSTMIKIADYFGCSLDYLADYNPRNSTEEERINWSDDELKEINNFKAFLLSKRKHNEMLNIKGDKQWVERKVMVKAPSFATIMDGEDKYL